MARQSSIFKNRIAPLLVVAFGVLAVEKPARAETSAPPAPFSDHVGHSRPHNVSAALSLWPDIVGVNGWYDISVIPEGFIPDFNDSFDVEFGALVAFYRNAPYWSAAGSTAMGITPSAGVRWNFNLTQRTALFLAAKLGVRFGFGQYDWGWLDVGGSIGLLQHLSDGLNLRIELGYPVGLSIGLNWLL